MAAADLLLAVIALIVVHDAVGRIREPDRAVRRNHDVVRRVEAPAFEPVGNDRDRAVELRPCHPSRQVLAGDKPPLIVDRVSVAVIARLAKHRDRAVGLIPAHHPIVRNVGPDEVATRPEPCRALQPAPARPKPLDARVPDEAGGKSRIEHFETCTLNLSKHWVKFSWLLERQRALDRRASISCGGMRGATAVASAA
ncbi:hypothetical protein BQ8794_30440 [Mesorhizobium prunaredense]|uniref:Uncharacterized protein n=1 Tax=Mesorhizobium prunaredense TaxID=1631249 RepID=A0A1R3VF14_9HYPH|nr:hypothetical protein BQ8794_30440 [Mesorhizobium prunaredense]